MPTKEEAEEKLWTRVETDSVTCLSNQAKIAPLVDLTAIGLDFGADFAVEVHSSMRYFEVEKKPDEGCHY